ncbi:acyl-CoA N-acyltransferase [Mycena capillaripes]|nr:acyl-CoA N-acyltransferase [Mycena capillaripes]
MPEPESSPAAHVRLATAEDLDELAAMGQRAFISSRPQTYLSGATSPLTTDPQHAERRAHQTEFLKFVIRNSWSMGERITVVILPGKPDKIVGLTIWRPPGLTNGPSIINALRTGPSSVIANWGEGFLTRLSDLVQFTEPVLREGYAERKIEGSPEDAWHLEFAGVDPEFQGKGYMSMLLREGLEHAPGAVFTVEANGTISRDVYKRYGFELVREVIVGKGKVDALAVIATGDAATGFPMYPMIRMPRGNTQSEEAQN